MRRRSDDVRQAILDAALRVTSRGISAFSIEAVAAEAGVSKGGLLHHFGTKEELLTALLDRFTGQAAEALAQAIAQVPPQVKARRIRGMLAAAFPHLVPEADSATGSATVSATGGEEGSGSDAGAVLRAHRDLVGGMIAAGQLNRALVERFAGLHSMQRRAFLEASDTGPQELLLWMALDGLALWQMLGLVAEGSRDEEELGRLLVAAAVALESTAAPTSSSAGSGARLPRERRS